LAFSVFKDNKMKPELYAIFLWLAIGLFIGVFVGIADVHEEAVDHGVAINENGKFRWKHCEK